MKMEDNEGGIYIVWRRQRCFDEKNEACSLFNVGA